MSGVGVAVGAGALEGGHNAVNDACPRPLRTAGVSTRQAEAALAAAFFCFLKSRTFCSEAGSTTSATER